MSWDQQGQGQGHDPWGGQGHAYQPGYGDPQGHGAPQGHSARQGYGDQRGYGDTQLYDDRQLYGDQQTYADQQAPWEPQAHGAAATATRPVEPAPGAVGAAEPVPGDVLPGTGPVGPAGADPAARPASRDRYFDTLRALALIRVVTYHTFGWAWCSLVFPSMGIMFGLAGTLMAKSLERPAARVVRSRMRRLLPPFWFWGLFVVLAMLLHGWMPGWQIVYWVVPLGDPPGNAWGEQAWEILWYLRTYLWFVLLSPALLWLFRKAPVAVLLLSLAPIVLLQWLWNGPDNRFGSALWDFSTYLFCWVLGFAHRDGVLRRLKPALVVAGSLAALGYGAWYAFAHRAEAGTYDLDEIALAQAFWSAGFVTLLMWAKAYFRIDFGWLARFRRTDRLVTVFNARAVTVYLWHEIALILAVPLIDRFWDVPAFEAHLPLDSQWFLFGVGWLLIAVFVLLCGWVEDVAARKRPRLLP
ncbi:acyltransferase family protein [Streptomyces sp. NPDC005840]|uniref:acyltransferase family protein n=1 Tax=Streptomyces sp. NPDC005840 TaxID=3157072 RepID=UPI00340D08BF